MTYASLELCAGGGGQALGLEMAGFHSAAALEIDPDCCNTLRANRPTWDVRQTDLRAVSGKEWSGIDLLAAGVPCPPFSIAGKQLGERDERDLFPEAVRLVREAKPRAVLLENVKGFAAQKFAPYRAALVDDLAALGYTAHWTVLQAADYGVPQLRPRFLLVALRKSDAQRFTWPTPVSTHSTVGPCLLDLMSARRWSGAKRWAERANAVGPTIVGGSRKHGGPDLGPTRARLQWRELGVDGIGIANEAPERDFPVHGLPKLTVRMVARLQSFPDDWAFSGKKTASYRQVGNALPPLVAKAVSGAIFEAFEARGVRTQPRAIVPSAYTAQRRGKAARTIGASRTKVG